MSTPPPKLLEPQLVSWLDHFSFKPPGKSTGLGIGTYSNKQKGASLHFADHRDYVPGDNTRHIDWKIFGRSNKLALKRFEKESELQCSILLDTSASMRFAGQGPAKLLFASKMAAALAYLLLKQGERVSFSSLSHLQSNTLPFRSGAKHFRDIETQLNQVMARGAEGNESLHQSLNRFIEQKTHRVGWVVILSDFFDDSEKLENALKNLQARGINVLALAVLDDFELDLPWDELVHFVPLESGEPLVADAKSLKKQYQKKLNAFLDTIESTVKTTGGHFQLCPTHESIKDTCATLFSLEWTKNR